MAGRLAMSSALSAAETACRLSGGSADYAGPPDRCLPDLSIAGGHSAVGPAQWEAVGRVRLGLAPGVLWKAAHRRRHDEGWGSFDTAPCSNCGAPTDTVLSLGGMAHESGARARPLAASRSSWDVPGAPRCATRAVARSAEEMAAFRAGGA